ncbi:MAG: hypothetical protein WKG07_08065 [Hymenobacter sp.]
MREPTPTSYTTDQSFPRLGQQGFSAGQVLSVSYYDDYDFDNNGQRDAAYDPSQDGQFAAGPAPVADALRTTGMPTRTKTRVLGVAENDPQQAAWLSTTTFYDERARPVQVQTTNARKGTDLLTTPARFHGQGDAERSHPPGPRPGPAADRGRVLHLRPRRPFAHQSPAAAGRSAPGPPGLGAVQRAGPGDPEDHRHGSSDPERGLRLQHSGLAHESQQPVCPRPSRPVQPEPALRGGLHERLRAVQRQPDGPDLAGSRRGAARLRLRLRPLNRLLQGDFVARTPAATPSAGAWTQELDNYRLSFVSYDDNGNLATLRRRGLLQAGNSHRPEAVRGGGQPELRLPGQPPASGGRRGKRQRNAPPERLPGRAHQPGG